MAVFPLECKEMVTKINKVLIWMVPLHFEFRQLILPMVSFQQEFKECPHDGEVLTTEHLAHHEIPVTCARLRASIHCVDPQGVASRYMHTVNHTVYHVLFSNYVWHLDSHHKLIRWGVVIHITTDGYSRKIICAFVLIITELTLF